MATYLDRILETHRTAAASDHRSLESLLESAREKPPARDFRGSLLASPDQIAVIAEVKRRSPSKGDLFVDLNPATLATEYSKGGASCLSVLTDTEWFGGSTSDLHAARSAVDLPVLRKDFTIDLRDVTDARIMGADCILLIVAALDDSELVDFHRLATELHMTALVEVHDEAELERALRAQAVVIGVNQRDLITFEVDQQRALRVAAAIPDGLVKVAESGIRNRTDVSVLTDAGYDAVLVGETLVRSGDPSTEIKELIGG